MKTEEQMKREQRKHFWIGVGEALLPLLVGCTVGYAVAKILMLAILI